MIPLLLALTLQDCDDLIEKLGARKIGDREDAQAELQARTLLEALFLAVPAGHSVVLEEDGIRVVTADEALSFWLRWSRE